MLSGAFSSAVRQAINVEKIIKNQEFFLLSALGFPNIIVSDGILAAGNGEEDGGGFRHAPANANPVAAGVYAGIRKGAQASP